jgi:23S rRNA (pseudouridine1915-N3)-methyltransferase
VKRITLICYGKLKTPGLEESTHEFMKRLSRYTDFQVVELKPTPIPEKSDTLRDSIPEKEGEQILELMGTTSFKQKAGHHPEIWCLDETGKAMKTSEWASHLKTIAAKGRNDLVLIIGGSLGVGHILLKSANRTVSFGPQTFSHELARLVLVEQLYRALSFNEGHPYHNEG